MYRILLASTLIFGLASCGVFQKSTDENKAETAQLNEVVGCEAIAIIRDYSSEIGCQFLYELEDGRMMYAATSPSTDAPYYEGAAVKIGYKAMKNKNDVVTGIQCSKHDFVAEITCIEAYQIKKEGEVTDFEDCKTIKNPYKYEWMRLTINKELPSRINEYNYSIGFIYEFVSEGKSVLYDCLGNRMCSTAESTDCNSLLESLVDPKVILVINN